MADIVLKAIKQTLRSTYEGKTPAEKKQYLWFVRESSAATDGDIYLGSRHYGHYGANDLSALTASVNDIIAKMGTGFTDVNTIAKAINDIKVDLATETNAREAADSVHDTRLDAVEPKVTVLENIVDGFSGKGSIKTAIETEENARKAAVSAATADTKEWVESKGYVTEESLSGKQDTLISGTNIKTINGQSVLGSGNIEIQGGSGATYSAGTNIDITNNIISVTGISVPTKTSQLTNDSGFLTEHQSLDEYAKSIDVTSAITVAFTATTAYTDTKVSSEADTRATADNALSNRILESEAKLTGFTQGQDVKAYVDNKVKGLLHFKGSVATIEALPELSSCTHGDVYNVVAAFDYEGKHYPAGTNVVAIKEDVETPYWDALGGTVDLEPYAKIGSTGDASTVISLYGARAYAKELVDTEEAERITADAGKQDKLVVSGDSQNIKTINGQSILGKGNIVIDVTGSTPYAAGANIAISEDKVISVTGMSEAISSATYDMATQSWANQQISGKADTTAVTQALESKANTATTLSGYGITDAKIEDNVITLGANSLTAITEHQDISMKADTTAMTQALSNKADKATTLSGYGITDAVKSVNNVTADSAGNVNVRTYSPVPSSMDSYKNGTTLQFCQKFEELVDPEGGSAYLTANICFTDMPFNGNAEMHITVPSSGIYVLEISSCNAFDNDSSAGKWITIYWGEMCMPWQGIMTCPRDENGYYVPLKGSDGASKYYVDTKLAGKANTATTLSGYGITDAKIENNIITLGANSLTAITEHQDISGKADKSTTLSGYGITDAKIENNVITLGNNTITPLTEHQSLTAYAKSADVATGLTDAISSAKTYTDQQLTGITHPEYTMATAATASGYSAIYELQKDGVKVGEQIRIPSVASAVLSSAITTDVAVGHVSAGTVYAAGTSIEKILRDIFMNSVKTEDVTLSLSASGEGSSSSDLLNTQITADGRTFTWTGSNIEFNVDEGTQYSVIFGSVSGYETPATQTYTAVGEGTRSVTGTYVKQAAGTKYYYTTVQTESGTETFAENGWVVFDDPITTNYTEDVIKSSGYFTKSDSAATTSSFDISVSNGSYLTSIVIPSGFGLSSVVYFPTGSQQGQTITSDFNIVQSNISIDSITYTSYTLVPATTYDSGKLTITFNEQ